MHRRRVADLHQLPQRFGPRDPLVESAPDGLDHGVGTRQELGMNRGIIGTIIGVVVIMQLTRLCSPWARRPCFPWPWRAALQFGTDRRDDSAHDHFDQDQLQPRSTNAETKRGCVTRRLERTKVGLRLPGVLDGRLERSFRVDRIGLCR